MSNETNTPGASAALALADKLDAEGARVATFISALPAAIWERATSGEGSGWTVRTTIEHMVLSEVELRDVFRGVAAGGSGAPENFDINQFNDGMAGSLDGLANDAVLARYRHSRAETVAFARGLSDAQLALRGRHPAMGETALGDMLKMVYLHNNMHLKDIKRAQESQTPPTAGDNRPRT